MKKISPNIFILCLLITLLLLGGYILFPREAEHGILIDSSEEISTFYLNGKLTSIKCKQLNFEQYTVLNFKFNLLKAYNFKEVPLISERVMVKAQSFYDLEHSGKVDLSSNTYFYQLDQENNISLVDSKKLIVGKSNVSLYKDKSGKLRTLLLAPMDYSTMRVAISDTNFTTRYHQKIVIKNESPISLYSFRETYKENIKEKSIVTIELVDGGLKLSRENGEKLFKERFYLQGEGMSLTSISRGTPAFIPEYNGIFEIVPSNSGILVINEVNLEEYLSKVVPSEMPANSALESLKCQAIAARTYAISDMLGNRFASEGFHVDDSTLSQVYNNIPLHPRSTEAVTLTKGLILTYNGEPIDAKYYSSSAGTGVNYSDIWFRSDGSSEVRPYLRTSNYITSKTILPTTEQEWLNFYKDKTLKSLDSTSPYFRWQIEFPVEALTKSLNKTLKEIYGRKRDFMIIKQGDVLINELPQLTNLKEIKVLKRSEGGNLIQIAFVFEDTVVELSGDSNIRSSIKCSKDYADTNIPIVRHTGNPINNSTSLPSSFFSVEKVKDTFIFYGGGYGHGVGMSQYGAMEMGKSGIDFKTILNTFYKDVIIEKIY